MQYSEPSRSGTSARTSILGEILALPEMLSCASRDAPEEGAADTEKVSTEAIPSRHQPLGCRSMRRSVVKRADAAAEGCRGKLIAVTKSYTLQLSDLVGLLRIFLKGKCFKEPSAPSQDTVKQMMKQVSQLKRGVASFLRDLRESHEPIGALFECHRAQLSLHEKYVKKNPAFFNTKIAKTLHF